jgi:hypothetical protein
VRVAAGAVSAEGYKTMELALSLLTGKVIAGGRKYGE